MREILVLGAGMVGISSALALQERGHSVTVVDRRGPGLETSYGNAGIIQSEAAEPYAIPYAAATLFRYAIGRTNDIIYNIPGLLRSTPALWPYFLASAPGRHARISQTYAKLTARSTHDHAPLIAAAGADDLVRRSGFYQFYRTPETFDAAAADADRLKKIYGVASTLLDTKALKTEEPALKTDIAGAVFWTSPWTVSDPGALTQAYAALFEARGGRIVKADVTTPMRENGSWRIENAGEYLTAEHLVVALGPWSPEYLKPLGYRIPMVRKRGYHGHFEMTEPLNRPLMDAANGVVLSNMRQGLRITTGAELTGPVAPANLVQLERGVAGARELVDIGAPIENSTWFGHRPCLPDMLPLVGSAPQHEGLWFNFGHGHQGFTLGPTTGSILADMIDGREDNNFALLKPENRRLRCRG
ncbi:NAD(P)/FAD-dependent oxidoreductase [Martelella mangrovi]|uniref:D-amino-acid dehydrogenase n=1 Tax=Martelella mangrovi TaxID=1397477 RepID=A0ABV2ICZ1_9HYPH